MQASLPLRASFPSAGRGFLTRRRILRHQCSLLHKENIGRMCGVDVEFAHTLARADFKHVIELVADKGLAAGTKGISTIGGGPLRR